MDVRILASFFFLLLISTSSPLPTKKSLSGIGTNENSYSSNSSSKAGYYQIKCGEDETCCRRSHGDSIYQCHCRRKAHFLGVAFNCDVSLLAMAAPYTQCPDSLGTGMCPP